MSELSPRERRHQRTRDAILKAAIALIRENGADNLSLRAIAERIDYSPAGLYEYFGSKDEIIDTVCREGNNRLLTYLKSVPETLPTGDYFVEMGLEYVRFARENPEMFALMFNNLEGPTQEITEDSLHPDDPFTLAYLAVQAAIDAGTIEVRDDYKTLNIAYSLWAFVHGMAVLQVTHLKAFPLDFARVDRKALETFVKGLFRGSQA